MTAGMVPGAPRTLLHVFSTFAVGGPQVRFAALVNHFGRRYRHLVVAMDGRTDCAARLSADTDFRLLELGVGKANLLRTYLVLRRHLAACHTDLLVTYNWGALEWGLANLPRLAPHVHVEDGFGPEEATVQLRRRVLFRRIVLGFGSTVVLPSRCLCRIAERQWRLPSAQLRYIPNGIDCARFAGPADPALAKELRRSPGELLVGTVAGLRREKNLHRLIEAFADVQHTTKARLIVVGDGPERAALEETARRYKLGDGVLFTGAVAAPERILGHFDVFGLSSDTEQMPLSIIEAMAAGLPIAAVDVGDVRDMVAEENRRFIVPPHSGRLADAMLALLDNWPRRQEIGAANRAQAKQCFDQTRMFRQYARLFDGPATWTASEAGETTVAQ